MKRLYILRHAHTLSTPPGGSDKDRVLSPQGEDDAQALGKVMQEKNYLPDFVLCSAATRTQQTLEQLNKTLDLNTALSPELYNAGMQDMIAMIEAFDDAHGAVLMIGHNPAIHGLVPKLAHDDSPVSFLNKAINGYAPATLSVLDCPIQCWNDLQVHENMLTDFLEPLDYNAPARPTRWM